MQGLFTALVVLVIFAIIVGSVLKQLYNALVGQQNQQAGGRAQAGVPGQQPQQARDTSEPPLEIRQFIEQVRGQRTQPPPQQQPAQPAQQPQETQQDGGHERVELAPPRPRTRRTGVMGTSSQPLTSSLGPSTLSSETTGTARSTVPQTRRRGKGARDRKSVV